MERKECKIIMGLGIISIFFLIMLPFQVDFSAQTSRVGKYITMTPGTFPAITIIMLVIFTVLYLYFNCWRKNWGKKETVAEEKKAEDPTNIKFTLINVAILLIYTALLNVIGFLIATILLCSVLSYHYKGRWYEVLVAGVILPVVFYYLFKLLYVPLPTGIWF